MTTTQIIITVAILAVSVQLTRMLPFLIFGARAQMPPFIDYLGKTLPAAMMGLLVVYCFKDYCASGIAESLANMWPALISCAFVAALHLWKRNTILSIALGTALYMVLIRL